MQKGDKLPLTQDQATTVNTLFRDYATLQEAIENMVLSADKKKRRAWELIREWFPEAHHYELTFTANKFEEGFLTILSDKKETSGDAIIATESM